MGVLSTMLGFDKSLWTDAVKALVPEKLRQLNLEAFELGVKAAG